jgi:transposase
MDVIETLKQDVQRGRISADRLIDLIASLQRLFQTSQQQLEAVQQQLQLAQQQLQATQQQLDAANKRIEELEKKTGGPPTAKVDEPYSMRSEEKRQEARGAKKKDRKPKGRRGRFKTQNKIAQAKRTERILPEGATQDECSLSHVRVVWRLENHVAVLIAYEIYRSRDGRYGQIPGVLGRCEFSLEIVSEMAHLVYVVGLSFDKACEVLRFFQDLQVRKSQVDSLLHRLARHWEPQFEALCTLLANSLVVHADETSWSLNSVWAFLSEKARILLFGVNKNAETLEKILDPSCFEGTVISDHAAVYENFSATQKCWAHLLRKAIKLTLQDPNNAEYRAFTDRLLEIYREACRIQRDQRLGDAGRDRKVVALEDALVDLCSPMWFADLPPLKGRANDYRLLVKEVFRLMIDQALFTFVTAPPVQQPNGVVKPVAGTNNEAERVLRGPAQARDTGRTDKASNGARRRTILTSVLESLRVYLPTYTLTSVLDELKRWTATGQSCFERLLKKLKLKRPTPNKPVVDRLFPNPSPSPIPTG